MLDPKCSNAPVGSEASQASTAKSTQEVSHVSAASAIPRGIDAWPELSAALARAHLHVVPSYVYDGSRHPYNELYRYLTEQGETDPYCEGLHDRCFVGTGLAKRLRAASRAYVKSMNVKRPRINAMRVDYGAGPQTLLGFNYRRIAGDACIVLPLHVCDRPGCEHVCRRAS